MRTIINADTGDVTVEADFSAPTFPESVTTVRSITRRQCARQLFESKMITGPEMVAMTATGTPPAMIEAVFSKMPEEAQWIARADFAADTYERSNPLLVGIMQASGATEAAIDDFFRAASRL
jgi:hypothetical protein